jgi:hypothetical protein
MMTAAEQFIPRCLTSANQLHLHVRQAEEATLKLYRSWGYEEVRRDSWLPGRACVLMRKSLLGISTAESTLDALDELP